MARISPWYNRNGWLGVKTPSYLLGPDHIMCNQPRSDLVLADCVRFWPNGSGPDASRRARIIGPASGQAIRADPVWMQIGSGMFTGKALANLSQLALYPGWRGWFESGCWLLDTNLVVTFRQSPDTPASETCWNKITLTCKVWLNNRLVWSQWCLVCEQLQTRETVRGEGRWVVGGGGGGGK